jgi:hypothetical protein
MRKITFSFLTVCCKKITIHKGGEIGRPAAGTPNGCGGQLESAARSAPGSARSSDSSGYFSRSDGGRFSMRSGSGQHTEYI